MSTPEQRAAHIVSAFAGALERLARGAAGAAEPPIAGVATSVVVTASFCGGGGLGLTAGSGGARLSPMPNPITAYQASDGSLYLTAQAAEAHDARTRAKEALVRFLRQYDLEGLPTASTASAFWRDWIDVCKLHAAAYPDPTRAQAEEAGRKPIVDEIARRQEEEGFFPFPRAVEPYQVEALEAPKGSIVYFPGDDFAVRWSCGGRRWVGRAFCYDGPRPYGEWDSTEGGRIWVVAEGLSDGELREWILRSRA